MRQLNKMEASGLIDELLDTHGQRAAAGRSGSRRAPSAYRRASGSGEEAA